MGGEAGQQLFVVRVSRGSENNSVDLWIVYCFERVVDDTALFNLCGNSVGPVCGSVRYSSYSCPADFLRDAKGVVAAHQPNAQYRYVQIIHSISLLCA
jgi:hypothetical protein